MFNSQKQITFTHEFTSPVYGNVYEGKKVTVDAKEADKLIKLGHAVETKKPVPVDPYAGMTAKQKSDAVKAKQAADKKAAYVAAQQTALDDLLALDKRTAEQDDEVVALQAKLKALKGE